MPKIAKQKSKTNDKDENNKLELLFEHMLDGFALHKIITDKKGVPIDYVFLRVNSAFEKLTGLKRDDILNKKVTEVIPRIEKDPANWISKYGKVALTGESIRFENYSKELKKWYAVSAYSPEKGYFVAIFEDITERKKREENEKKDILKMKKIQKITVDRELKMIELKKRIEELEKKK